MKLACTKACMNLYCALACLLPMGICPGGVLCADPDRQADLGQASGQECCGHASVSGESFSSFECPATERSRHKCCIDCSDSPSCFGCDGELILPSRTKSITLAAFVCTGAITNDAGLAQDGLPSQSSGTANAALSFLRTIILLT